MQRFASDVVAAFDLIDDIILVLAPGADGPCVLDVNETFTRVAGHSAEAMRGRTLLLAEGLIKRRLAPGDTRIRSGQPLFALMLDPI